MTRDTRHDGTDLMSTTYQIQIVFVQELGNNVGTESVRDSAIIFSPSHHVFVRIRPQQVTQQSLVRDVSRSLDPANLFHGMQVGTESSVTTKDLLVHDRRHWQAVEAVGESLPQFDVVPSFAWTQETEMGALVRTRVLFARILGQRGRYSHSS